MRISDWSSDVCSSDLNESGAYRVGSQVLSVAYPLLARFKIRQAARPFMRDFAVRAGGNVSMAMSNGLHAIMLDVTRSDDTVVSDYISDIGFSVPLYSTAVGRAILSLMTSGERSALHTRTLERSEEPKSELQPLMRISYAVFCLK